MVINRKGYKNGLNQAIGKAVVLNIIIIPFTFFTVLIIFFMIRF